MESGVFLVESFAGYLTYEKAACSYPNPVWLESFQTEKPELMIDKKYRAEVGLKSAGCRFEARFRCDRIKQRRSKRCTL